MVSSFIIALREGVEAALVIAIALAYLRKIGREDLHRTVYRALAAAVAASLAGAWLFQKLQWTEEAFEGWTLLASAAFVFTLVVWMWRHTRGIKAEMERKLGAIAERDSGARTGIFLFVFLMVFREGVETVLLLSAASFTSDSILKAAGLGLGLALSVAFGITFIRGAVRIDLRRFFRITTVILFVVVLQLLVTGLHELSEGGFLPSSSREMALIGPVVRSDVFFFVTILALAAWMVLLDWRAREPVVAGEPGSAVRRKAIWTARRERFWMFGVCSASFVFILFATAEFIYARAESQLTPAIPLTAVSGQVRIPVASVSDGMLHRFAYEAPSKDNHVTVRVIVIQKPDGSLAAALDACLICGNQGYYQKGPHVLCKNCASAIYIPSIGTPGGCNPVALRSHVERGDLVLDAADLDPAAKYFLKPSAGS
jgi:high-affinity iron transporter